MSDEKIVDVRLVKRDMEDAIYELITEFEKKYFVQVDKIEIIRSFEIRKEIQGIWATVIVP